MHVFVAPILSVKCLAVKGPFRLIQYWVTYVYKSTNTEEPCCHSESCEKSPDKSGVSEEFPRSKIIIDLVFINEKKRTCQRTDFTVSTDHKVKLKENENLDEYTDLARKLLVIPNVIVTREKLLSNLEKDRLT